MVYIDKYVLHKFIQLSVTIILSMRDSNVDQRFSTCPFKGITKNSCYPIKLTVVTGEVRNSFLRAQSQLVV